MTATNTFTFSEYENGSYSWSNRILIRYCSYCGNKAKREDVGSSHNHRWEEDIIYFCECGNAQKEKEIKNKIAGLNNELFHANRELESMGKLADNNVVKKMKCDKEIENIKKKYKIEE